MKSKKLIYLIIFAILFTCSCGNNESPDPSKEIIENSQINTNKDDDNVTNTSTVKAVSASDEQINPYNYEDLSSLPEIYTLEIAEKNNNVVWTFDKIANLELLDNFKSNVENGINDMVRIVTFTKEGDSIISDLEYNGKVITLTDDSTRDKFSSNPSIQKYEFDYIVIENRYNEHYKGTFIEYILKKESDDSSFIVLQIAPQSKE